MSFGDYMLFIVGAILVNNILLAKFLGNCPFLGVSKPHGHRHRHVHGGHLRHGHGGHDHLAGAVLHPGAPGHRIPPNHRLHSW